MVRGLRSRGAQVASRWRSSSQAPVRALTEEVTVYLSRLTFTTLPGHTRQVEDKLRSLRDLVGQAGGTHVRVLRTHFASLGAQYVEA